MDGLFSIVRWFSKILNIVAGVALALMMFLTVADVLFRAGGRSIVGTYEIVALLLGLVIGFGIPQVSIDKGHVYMEFLLERLPRRSKDVMNTFTRLLCLVLFLFIGYKLLSVAAGYQSTGEVTATIKLPFYPVAYGVAICCFLECAVFALDIAGIWRSKNE